MYIKNKNSVNKVTYCTIIIRRKRAGPTRKRGGRRREDQNIQHVRYLMSYVLCHCNIIYVINNIRVNNVYLQHLRVCYIFTIPKIINNDNGRYAMLLSLSL